MRAPVVIAAKDLRQRIRDRSAITVGLVAPVAIAALMSVAFHGAESFHFTLGVVNADAGPVGTELVAALKTPALRQIFTTSTVKTEASARTQVRHRALDAALVIPAGFSAAASGSSPSDLRTLGSVNNSIAATVTESVASSFVAQINADRLSVATAIAAGAPESAVPALSRAAATLRVPMQAVATPLGANPVKPVSYYAPAMAIFFLFFTIGFTSRSFFAERARGMVERMRAAPIRPFEILLGKVLSAFVFGVVSIGLIAVVTSLGFGADWGSPLAAGAVCLAMVVAVVCLTALVIGVSRTERQAEGIATAVTFVLALVGGNFVFISAAPSIMQRISLFTPNGWALRALTDLSTTGGGVGAVAVPVLAILAFSAIVGVLAALAARRAVGE